MNTHPMNVGVIAGAGSDASPEKRPGIPMEYDPPHAVGAAHWQEPERQKDPGNILRRRGLAELTPVFGTAVPPRGLSGMLRRAAYRIADHRTSHWLVLMLADRVDVLEDRARRLLPVMLPLAMAGGGLAVVLGRRRRRTPLQRWLG